MMEKRTEAVYPGALVCACANLRRASRAVTQLYDEELRPTGLEPTQFTLLMALHATGEVTQGKLGQRLAIDSTTLTRSLAPLRARGWISSRRGQDRRERLWRLASAGRRELERAQPYWERAQRRLRKALGQDEWSSLQELLVRVTQATGKG